MSDETGISGVGVNPASEGGVGATSVTISKFNAQNLSPSAILEIAAGIPTSVGGIPGVGSSVPGLGKVGIPGLDVIGKTAGRFAQYRLGVGGTWESLHYAADLNNHHPKFKFLFKVLFVGFNPPDNRTSNFYYYVHRVDKPKVKLVHADVNYYNFRTRVLTHVIFDPLTITFLDEIGNSVNQFFVEYLRGKSGQGSGRYGTDYGQGEASSSFPYDVPKGQSKPHKGYSDGKEIILEQVFANGFVANRFHFLNPRIEAFDFDELNMDDNAGSALTCQFSYDALRCETNDTYATPWRSDPTTPGLLYSWGLTDLKHGGGTSGPANAGDTTGSATSLAQSASGLGAGDGLSCRDPTLNSLGANAASVSLPSLSNDVAPGFTPGGASVYQDVASRDIQTSAAALNDGSNAATKGLSGFTAPSPFAAPPTPFKSPVDASTILQVTPIR